MAEVKIRIVLDVEVYRDRGTKSWLYLHRKYNISGYGETRKEAKEMFLYCVNDILIFKKQKLNK